MSRGGEGPGGRGPGSCPPSSYPVWMLHGWAERGGWCETMVPQHPVAAHPLLVQWGTPPDPGITIWARPGQERHCESVTQKQVCSLGPSLVRGGGRRVHLRPPAPPHPCSVPSGSIQGPRQSITPKAGRWHIRGVRDGAGEGSTAESTGVSTAWAGGTATLLGPSPSHPLLSLRMEVEGPQFPRGS